MVTLVVLLVKMGPALTEVSPWVVIAVLLLAVGCIAASFAILAPATVNTKTLVVCNVNRHVGLALLLSGTDWDRKHSRRSRLMRLRHNL